MSEFNQSKKAVALKYDSDKDKAPVVVASGMGYMAERITEAAMKAGVPVYEDDSLATLLSQLKLGAPIPEDLYRAVVEIYLYFLKYVPGRDQEELPEGTAPALESQEAQLAGDDDSWFLGQR